MDRRQRAMRGERRAERRAASEVGMVNIEYTHRAEGHAAHVRRRPPTM